MNKSSLEKLLNNKYKQYNTPEFIISDPVSIPHRFTKKEDIEIAAFLAATIAWGYRPNIIKSAEKLIKLLNNSPFDFIMNVKEKELKPFQTFTHRTFQGDDASYFIYSLKNIYQYHNGLQTLFYKGYRKNHSIKDSIIYFRKIFFECEHLQHTEKHISNPENNSSCKRINLFLRWMIRNDKRGVDFGIWKNIPSSALLCPLDLHSGNVSRKLGLLTRNQNDWKAVEELTANLKKFDPDDPVKYDFALFGLGIFEKF
ncbi:MAG: TIGR02757 family protein [Bacteroidales bacterium]